MDENGIFLATGGDFVVLSEQPYESELVLQKALAEHPEVIAGPTTMGADSGALLLVRREMGVPAVPGGGQVWSLDHLFLDAEGVPVIVEVKRSSDTRIRREVVGQLLDYAANGVKYWPLADIRAAVEQTAAQDGRTGEEAVSQLRPDIDPEDFWRVVQSNLTEGRIRMLLVADKLPPELVRIIEFLNEQMSPAEVLGVELRQFVGGGHTVYVPQLVGRTSAAVKVKESVTGQQWNEDTFWDAARSRGSEYEVLMVERLVTDVKERGVKIGWGKGITPGITGWYQVAGRPTPVWNLNLSSDGHRAYMSIYLSDLARRLLSETIEQVGSVLRSIPSLAPRVTGPVSGWQKYPSLYLSDISNSPEQVSAVIGAIRLLTAPDTEMPSTARNA